MKNEKQKPDYSGFPPELQAKIAKWEANKPANRQLNAIEDIADMLQSAMETAADDKKSEEKKYQEIGAVLLDIRELLKYIRDKKDPEAPDISKPLQAGVEKLGAMFDKSIKSIDVKPVVNVPKQEVKAPVVNVDIPAIDISEFVKVMRSEMPKAFKEAIKLIPKTDVVIPEAPDRWDEVLGWLESIDNASRLQPTAPKSMVVTNADGTSTADVNLKQSNTILFAKVDTAASGDTPIVAADTTRKIKLLSCKLIANGTVLVKWRSGTTDLEGANSLVANSGYVLPASSPGQGHYLETAVNTALNINLSGAVQVSGHISYYLEA